MKTKIYVHDLDGDIGAYVTKGNRKSYNRRGLLTGFYWADEDDPEERGDKYDCNREGYAFLTVEVTTERGSKITWYASIDVSAEHKGEQPKTNWCGLAAWGHDLRNCWQTGPRPTGKEWERAKAAAKKALLPWEAEITRVLTAGKAAAR